MSEVFWPLMSNNISREDLDALISYLSQENPKLTHGPKVAEFEELWSKWLGVNYSCMVNSGSSANDLTMLALKEMVGVGEVIVPTLTWVSDIASVVKAGFTPVFVDIDSESLGMAANQVLDALSPRTKAVFITHILGFDAFEDSLITELKSRNVLIIEDVCESHGASHSELKLGSIGFASNFSFYFAHHMSTIEGGMISSNNEEFIDICRMMRSHGLVRESRIVSKREEIAKKFNDLNPEFIFKYLAHNMRPTELNAILGINQLKRLNENVKKRNSNFVEFLSVLDPSVFQVEFKLAGSSNYAFVLILREPNFQIRNKVESLLSLNSIEFRRGLSGGGNQVRQPYYIERFGVAEMSRFPRVEHVHQFAWYLGNYPNLPQKNIEILGNLLSEFSRK